MNKIQTRAKGHGGTSAETGTAAAVAPVFQLLRQASGTLLFGGADGQEHEGVVPVRSFPLTAPEEGIVLVSADGHELLWIDSLQGLPEYAAALLREELAVRDFMPEISRLISVSSLGTPSLWTVETDRGNTTFTLKAEEDIRRLKNGALLIGSGEGALYGIADVVALDRNSRRLLERFL